VIAGGRRRDEAFHDGLLMEGILKMYFFKKQKSILARALLRHHAGVDHLCRDSNHSWRQLMTTEAIRRRRRAIPGTTIFDGDLARIGYALNRMCYSFNAAEAREAFLRDEEAYMTRYQLTEAQKDAVRSRQVLRMIEAGGHPYYLAKLAGIFGLDMQDIGAQQTGVTKEEFRARLVAAGE
jgi:protocatechuate 4,5-dioxygenase alpha chain